MRYWRTRHRECYDGHGAGVTNDVANRIATVGQLDAQAVDVEDAAGPGHVLGERALRKSSVARIVVSKHELALLRSSRKMVLARTVTVIGEGGNGITNVIYGIVKVGSCWFDHVLCGELFVGHGPSCVAVTRACHCTFARTTTANETVLLVI